MSENLSMNDLIKKNEQLKSALKDLIKEKATLEYLVYKSFAKILNSKKRRIKELEEKIASLKAENGGPNSKKDVNKPLKRAARSVDTSSEEECSEKFYEKDTDVDDSQGEKDSILKLKDRSSTSTSPVKKMPFVNTSASIANDESETDLSQSQSEENESQYALKPYSNSLPTEDDEISEQGEGTSSTGDSKGTDAEAEGPSRPKRTKIVEESTTDSDLLEELLDDI